MESPRCRHAFWQNNSICYWKWKFRHHITAFALGNLSLCQCVERNSNGGKSRTFGVRETGYEYWWNNENVSPFRKRSFFQDVFQIFLGKHFSATCTRSPCWNVFHRVLTLPLPTVALYRLSCDCPRLQFNDTDINSEEECSDKMAGNRRLSTPFSGNTPYIFSRGHDRML